MFGENQKHISILNKSMAAIYALESFSKNKKPLQSFEKWLLDTKEIIKIKSLTRKLIEYCND